ncbi:MAG: hypothetical protein P1U61_00265 [Legionellaceae bacterium]|nr:hypothetical protein [Legionellaceae bacterium]
MVDYLLVIMHKTCRYSVLLFFLLLPVYANIGAESVHDLSAKMVPDVSIDSGTDETPAEVTEVNVAADTARAKAAEAAEKLQEEKNVVREVNEVIGKEGRGVVGYRDLFYPQYHGLPLSYCSEDHKTCGLKLASKYCELLGYNKASRMMIAHNVGLTRYPLTKVQCKGWRCDGFKLITCEESLKKIPTPVYYYRMRDFALPRIENYRMAWCYKEKKGCGRRAADAFCRQQGYLRSKGYEKSTEVAATRTIGSGALCFGQACNGFGRITCYR